ncbi:MAG: enoyl-CoA hydratase-related protein [Gemmatales bacterium]|nr:enoyl-CoA hydratase-related protein [Gemmatales bacterium]MCS7160402.1 enoyl-CoA hydratase-related protein [Gemmatales bacterium]MDW8175602.1 enoyl-CoA hydratase-related protein [Gemmatales bacterium]MDW8224018.1 enoyl-CoA hydratase-related protein [Gemmatales bacterium]
MSDLVLVHVETPAAIITLNRPEKRNALNRALVAQLIEAFARASADGQVRAVILTANGPAFCAGMDLAELAETLDRPDEAEQVHADTHRLAELYELIYACPKPTIAAVPGPAVAGGAGLVTVCDLALATPQARFGYPEVRRGLVAAIVLPHLLRLVGERLARELLLGGELMDAPRAYQVGLINAIVSESDLLPTALQWARRCALGGPQALAKTKELLRRFSPFTSASQVAEESASSRLQVECREGLRAFLEKRPAPWVK